MKRTKTSRLCQLPKVSTISGRSSSVRNAFFNSVIPVHQPKPEEELEALSILGMTAESICCAYCGDSKTEWDHFRPVIRDKRPTGYITEIANLVPACGKCNQSKGGYDWKRWMLGPAALSPKSRGIADLDIRVKRLEAFAVWRKPVKVNVDVCVPLGIWDEHLLNCENIVSLLYESQKLAKSIRSLIDKGTQRFSESSAGE
jgi:5-methylcytosine-specific restriction endonuclease McrA